MGRLYNNFSQLDIKLDTLKFTVPNFLKVRVFLFNVLSLAVLLFVLGCVAMGSGRLLLRQDLLTNQYDTIKKIVIEEAANGGFSQLTSEVKPSQFNNWKGQLYFALKTPSGTDQLYVKFEMQGDKIFVYMHGAGARANPDSAIKAITARLSQL